MPQPEGRGLTQNFSPRLTNLALSYLPQQDMLIGRKVFPAVGVGAASGEYNILPRGEFLRLQAKELANHEAPPIGGFKFSKDTYSVKEWGLSANWTQRDLNAAEVGGISAAKLVEMKTQFVTFQAHLHLEKQVADLVRTAANWTVSLTGVAASPGASEFLQWNDASSDPIALVKQQKLAMQLATGFRPNRMLMGQAVVDALCEHPDLIDRVKYTGSNGSPAKINKAALAELFEVDEILVPGAVLNSAQEGASDSVDWLWGKDVFLWFAPAAASMELPSAGYRFNWTGAVDSGGVGPAPHGARLNSEGLYIARYRENRPAAEFVESRWYGVPKVTGADLGILLKSAVA